MSSDHLSAVNSESVLKPGAEIAVIGTGIMGGHMACRLAGAGFKVSAWNRSPEKCEALRLFSVVPKSSLEDALETAQAAIIMLSTGAVIEDVLFAGDTPAIRAMPTGSRLIVMSSIPVDTCRAQAEVCRGLKIDYIDAPVSGGEGGARDGNLVILAGGAQETINDLSPMFAPLGRVTRLGDIGAGQMAKLANQIMVAANMLGVAEAFQFMVKGGGDIKALQAALQGGFASSRVLELHGARMVAGDFTPGSPAQYQLKDLNTARDAADDMGLNPDFLHKMIEIFSDMMDHGGRDRDVSAVFEEIGRRSSLKPTE